MSGHNRLHPIHRNPNDGRGVARFNDYFEPHQLESLVTSNATDSDSTTHGFQIAKAFVERNEPFVWRHFVSDPSLLEWWQHDENLLQDDPDTIIPVRIASRQPGDNPSTPTLLSRLGPSPYQSQNMTLEEYLRGSDDNTNLDSSVRYAAQLSLSTLPTSFSEHLPSVPTWLFAAMGPREQETMYLGGGKNLQGGGVTTQLHYDSQENWVCVLRGSKDFILYDPMTSAALLYMSQKDNGNVSPILDANHQPNIVDYPMAKYALPVTTRLFAGDCLYLPIYWFHAVTTSGPNSISMHWWRRPEATKKDIMGRLFCGQAHRSASAHC